MAVFSGNLFYFDEDDYGISDGTWFDNVANLPYFDAYARARFNGHPRFGLIQQSYTANEIGTLIIRDRFIGIEDYSKFVDLMKLIPAKFRPSIALQQFVYQMGLDVGAWIGDINDLEQNLDPYYVAQQYLPYLARLIGLSIISDNTTSDDNKRQQLLQAIDLYKIKGTYQALKRAAYLANVNVDIWDMYCSAAGLGSETNYNNADFTNEAWWAGPVGTNPPDLDSTYFKTPHIGIVLPLTVVQGTYPNEYLYKSSMMSMLITIVETIRPVNVVPHYTVSLYGQADYTGTVDEEPGRVQTCLIGGWEFPGLNYDVTPTPYNHDQTGPSIFFDQTPEVALHGINRWKLGTGSKNIAPNPFTFDLETPVLSGDIDYIDINGNYAEYTIKVPKSTVQSGISELGLYLTDASTIKLGCTFPDIDLAGDVELTIKIKFYFA